jgi:hypothetical protein
MFQHRAHKTSLLYPTLREIILLHILKTYFFKIRFIIFLVSRPKSRKWSLSIGFSN